MTTHASCQVIHSSKDHRSVSKSRPSGVRLALLCAPAMLNLGRMCLERRTLLSLNGALTSNPFASALLCVLILPGVLMFALAVHLLWQVRERMVVLRMFFVLSIVFLPLSCCFYSWIGDAQSGAAGGFMWP